MVLRKTGCDENYVGLIIILYFDEDQRSCMVVVGFWKTLGVYFLYRKFCILGLTTVQSLCCQIFVKSKGVILIEKVKNFITHVFQIQFQQF